MEGHIEIPITYSEKTLKHLKRWFPNGGLEDFLKDHPGLTPSQLFQEASENKGNPKQHWGGEDVNSPDNAPYVPKKGRRIHPNTNHTGSTKNIFKIGAPGQLRTEK